MDLVSAQKVLDELAGRAILVDIDHNGESVYALPPAMADFFEFSLMRVRDDIDQKVLSEMFYQYLNVEEDFIRDLFTRGETHLGRAFVHEPALSNENVLYVLDYERATHIIKTASHRAISICYCRYKMLHVDKACDAPMDICMTFNNTASSLIKHGFARRVDITEGLDLLQSAYDNNLVQFGENVKEEVNFICNCCGCCCEAMIAARRFAIFNPIHTTNFIPEINKQHCIGCGKCVITCPVEAMALVSANNPDKPKMKKFVVFILMILVSIASANFCLAKDKKNHICFRIIDSNKDGEITFKEFEKYFGNDNERFKEADSNKNGKRC